MTCSAIADIDTTNICVGVKVFPHYRNMIHVKASISQFSERCFSITAVGENANCTMSATYARTGGTSASTSAIAIWCIKNSPLLNAATAQNRFGTTNFLFRAINHHQVVTVIDAIIVEVCAVIGNTQTY